MAKSFCNLLYHLVFSTKGRRPYLSHPEIRSRVHEYLGGAIRGEGGIALAINGMPDHVHVLAKLRQTTAVADVLRQIKANSSGWIHQTFPDLRDFAWQEGYGAFTVSVSQVTPVRSYIENQARHHRARTFQEEFLALLDAHEVEYDERYVWN